MTEREVKRLLIQNQRRFRKFHFQFLNSIDKIAMIMCLPVIALYCLNTITFSNLQMILYLAAPFVLLPSVILKCLSHRKIFKWNRKLFLNFNF